MIARQNDVYANNSDMGKDLYSVLDINTQTNKAEIRQAYLQLARQFHPDINKNPQARERFEEITLAYNVLYDDETRVIYNLYRKNPHHLSRGQEQLPWWKRYKLALDVIILLLGVLVWMSLVIYLLALS